MKLHEGSSHNRTLAEINITPFVDVVLVLLIIFMITAPLLQQGFTVELPKAASPKMASDQKDVVLIVNQRGDYFLGDTKTSISKEDLTPKLYTIYRNKEKKDLLIQADQSLQYRKVIEAMSIAHQAGVERIGIVTQPEKK